jgi:3-oxoacyl-[acyl-carrier-protein] synthase II
VQVAITGYEMVCCLGDAARTFAALCRGETGVTPLRPDRGDADRLGVRHAYQIGDGEPPSATRWLAITVAAAAARAGIDTAAQRVAVVVGTGLRELPALERWSRTGTGLGLQQLHFGSAVRDALPGVTEVLTLSNACSAGGCALAVAADMLAAREADAVVVAGCDAMTQSMLASIGRGSVTPTTAIRPFDRDRTGVLLGEGAAAVVLRPAEDGAPPQTVLRGVGLSCDAHHETAPDVGGIVTSMRDAHDRAGVAPNEVDLVVAHGTGTALNDPTEAAALTEVFGDRLEDTLVTGIKGAIGHTSGAAALMSLIVAIQALRHGTVPAVAGLSRPIEEAARLRLVRGGPEPTDGRVAQIDAFGFGGLNAVSIVEVA